MHNMFRQQPCNFEYLNMPGALIYAHFCTAEPPRPSHILEVYGYDAAEMSSMGTDTVFSDLVTGGATIKCPKSAGM